MNVGMLWFDNDPKVGMEIKIERAANYYVNKYGKTPNVCFVHPSMLAKTSNGAGPSTVVPIEVRPSISVMPNHFWIGINGTLKPAES